MRLKENFEPWEERLIQEMLDLKSKLRNLKKYLKEHPEDKEPDSTKRHNLWLMKVQSWDMEYYLMILIKRLKTLGIWDEQPN